MTDKLYLDWQKLDTDTEALLKKLPNKSWTDIVAITRGGMLQAQLLAYALGVNMVHTFCCRSYHDKQQGELEVLLKPNLQDSASILVVEDMVDTGETIKEVRKHFPSATYACLYAKPAGKDTIDHYVQDVEQDRWIVFPWDRFEDMAPKPA